MSCIKIQFKHLWKLGLATGIRHCRANLVYKINADQCFLVHLWLLAVSDPLVNSKPECFLNDYQEGSNNFNSLVTPTTKHVSFCFHSFASLIFS